MTFGPVNQKSRTPAATTKSSTVMGTTTRYAQNAEASREDSIVKNVVVGLIPEAEKVNLSFVLKSKESESIEFNSLHTPDLTVEFVYNYFIDDESNVETEEDQSQDPLLNTRHHAVPRYAELKWDVSHVTEVLAGTEEVAHENTNLKRSTLYNRKAVFGRDSTNFQESLQKQRVKTTPLSGDGAPTEVVDIHSPERGFSAIANDREFASTVTVTVGTQDQKATVLTIPFDSAKESR